MMSLFDHVKEKWKAALHDWELMKTASEEESEEVAERFEMHFYQFIDELKSWYQHLEQPPTTIEEAENLSEIKEVLEQMPAPLELNFYTELELIIEGEERFRFD
jgi:hypothetical protein